MLGFINKDQSLTGVLTVTDGNGTKISNGSIQCKTLTSKNSIITNNNACNNLLVGGILSVGSNITCANLKTRTIDVLEDINIDGNLKYKYQLGCKIHLKTFPFQCDLISSVDNTQLTNSSLNLFSFLGLTGNGCSISLYPHYKIIFMSNRLSKIIILLTIDNTNGTNILYKNILFNTRFYYCDKIDIFYDGEKK